MTVKDVRTIEVIDTEFADGEPPELFDEGDGPKGCRWHESVCTDSPTHGILGVPGGAPHFDDEELYCARHYALVLGRFIEVHLPQCHRSLEEHVRAFGPIGELYYVREVVE